MFIFVLLKHKFSRKTVGVSGIRTRIDGVEGENADDLTTTMALPRCVFSAVLVKYIIESCFVERFSITLRSMIKFTHF